MEKPHVLPSCFPFGSLHFCQVRENADRAFSLLRNEEFQLRLECVEFCRQQLSDYFKAERDPATVFKSLNHWLTFAFYLTLAPGSANWRLVFDDRIEA